MDRHFRFADPAENVPLIAAFADRLYVEEFALPDARPVCL